MEQYTTNLHLPSRFIRSSVYSLKSVDFLIFNLPCASILGYKNPLQPVTLIPETLVDSPVGPEELPVPVFQPSFVLSSVLPPILPFKGSQPLHLEVVPLSRILLIWPNIRPLSVNAPILKLTFIKASIGPLHLPFSALFPMVKKPLIDRTVTIVFFALSLQLIIHPKANRCCAVDYFISSFSICFILFPFPLIGFPVGVYYFSIPFSHAILVLTFIEASICEDLPAFSFFLPVFNIPLADRSIRQMHN